MSIWVTGGAGFVGSNLVQKLNEKGIFDILIIDDLSNGEKFKNLKKCTYERFYDVEDFSEKLKNNELIKPTCIFHQGAISDTTERNGKVMFKHNYNFSILLIDYAIKNQITFIYASSAAVYGLNKNSFEDKNCEDPINVYGYSKLAFDNYVRSKIIDNSSQIVGLRYFNVYGFGEFHKGKMASTIYQFQQQFLENKKVYLFGEYLNYKKGEQSRDFVHVDDVIDTNLWFFENKSISGIFNVGTGISRTFNEVAKEIIKNNIVDIVLRNKDNFLEYIKYIKFPDNLKGRYQNFTVADLGKLRNVGFKHNFLNIEEGIKRYIQKIKPNEKLF